MTDDKRMTIKLPKRVHAVLVQMACAEMRSLNRQILWLLEQAADEEQARQQDEIRRLGAKYGMRH